MENQLAVKHLTFSYGEETKKALDDVSFSVKKGEFVVVSGRSGCGKTTLFRLLKRELAPAGVKEGEIFFEGTPQEALSDRQAAADIGFVLQNPESQIVMDKVWHELAFGLENLGEPVSVIRRRVGEMANYFGIHQWFHKKTADLSGGQKQMLNLASVLLMRPKLLILDEPTAQMDPIAASDFIATLKKLNQEFGMTVLLCEHRLEEVLPAAHRVILMERGKIVMDTAPGQVSAGLKQMEEKKDPLVPVLLQSMPGAVRIFYQYDCPGPGPLTVREGKEFLAAHFDCRIKSLPAEEGKTFEEKEKAISLKNVWFRYEREQPDILRGASLEAAKGEIVSILGGNGSGKTTLLHVIAGLQKPHRGSVQIGGKKISAYKNGSLYRQNLSLLPQDPQTLFIKETVREDFLEAAKLVWKTPKDCQEQIRKVAELLELTPFLERHPYDLSGGEQQKAALGKILLLRPEILLLDEPTKGLDAWAKQGLIRLMKQLSDQGITLLLVSHDVEFCAEVSHRCGLFFDGTVISLDQPQVFFSENTFYTTAASRISREQFHQAVTCGQVSALCKENGFLR